MTPIEQLITAAMRYCIFQVQQQERYWAIHDPKTETSYSLDIPTRAALSRLVLEDLERMVDKPFQSIEECKDEIKGLALGKRLPAPNPDILRDDATRLEKREVNTILANHRAVQHFAHYIDNVTEDQLATVDPLPYRRRLSNDESAQVRVELKDHWRFEGFYWVPLIGTSSQPLIVFHDWEPEDPRWASVKAVIRQLGSPRAYELDEFGKDYEIESSELEFCVSEMVYTSMNYEWVVYTSHEGTLALGGKRLLEEVEVLFWNDLASDGLAERVSAS